MLVDASELWLLGEHEADQLELEGHVPHAVGCELFPPKRIFFLNREQLLELDTKRQSPVRLTPDVLDAASLVLVPHAPHEMMSGQLRADS